MNHTLRQMIMAMLDDNNNNLYIPEDALMEILARLPVESLLRFLCVSKSWYDLIKSPNFITTHVKYAFDDDEASRIVVVDNNYYNDDPYIATFLSNDGVEIYNDSTSSFLFDIHPNLIWPIELSSCNGVICVCYSDPYYVKRVALWNPAIREVNYLVLDGGIAYEQWSLIGFGINPKSNVYKVIRYREVRSKFAAVDIYDVGNNNDSWRKLDDVPAMTGYPSGSVYADGFCYWLVFSGWDCRFVISFDFINEVFERIPTPPGAKYMNISSMPTTFGESVAFIGSSFDHDDCNIVWVLSREGDKKTWIKRFSLPKEYELFPRFLRSGKIVMLARDQVDSYNRTVRAQVDLYDPTTHERKKLMVPWNCVEIMNYVESLISFKKYFPPYPKQNISACESLHKRQVVIE